MFENDHQLLLDKQKINQLRKNNKHSSQPRNRQKNSLGISPSQFLMSSVEIMKNFCTNLVQKEKTLLKKNQNLLPIDGNFLYKYKKSFEEFKRCVYKDPQNTMKTEIE